VLNEMSPCTPFRTTSLKMNRCSHSDSIRVIVGDSTFTTTKRILTADPASFLSTLVQPQWEKLDGTSTIIHTPSESPTLFEHILYYLEALADERSNLCPNIDSLSDDEVHQLLDDCRYLILDQLRIEILISISPRDASLAEKQRALDRELSKMSENIKKYEQEKLSLERRLEELPNIIAREKAKYANKLTERSSAVSLRPADLDERIVITIESKPVVCRVALRGDEPIAIGPGNEEFDIPHRSLYNHAPIIIYGHGGGYTIVMVTVTALII
jgi:hypothetical protein